MDGDQQTLTKEEKLLLNDLMPRVAQIVHGGRDVIFDRQILTGEIGELLTLMGRLAQRRVEIDNYQWITECADVFIQCYFLATRINKSYFFRTLHSKLEWVQEIYENHDK